MEAGTRLTTTAKTVRSMTPAVHVEHGSQILLLGFGTFGGRVKKIRDIKAGGVQKIGGADTTRYRS